MNKMRLMCLPQLIFASLILAGSSVGYAQPKSISDLAEGPPQIKGKTVPDAAYVEVMAKQLAHAKWMYVNFKWLRAWCKTHQVPFPENGLDEKLKEELASLTYQIPRRTDSPAAFTDKEKKVYADRIGGDGLNNNFGSGRAASNGFVQVKGIGRTPLVSAAADFDHAHGGSSLTASAVEAVFAAVNSELPYGSNPVIGVFETGTFAPWDDSGEEELAAVVREDPIRLGAFVPRDPHEGDGHPEDHWHWTAEEKRIEAYKKFMVNALPQHSSSRQSNEISPRKKFIDGIKEEARRMGEQTGAAYARGINHHTTSASNILINGGYIDYGTQSYQPGFARTRYIDEVAPPGIEEVGQLVDILPAMNFTAPENVKNEKGPPLPTTNELQKIGAKAFKARLKYEFLLLTGVPAHVVEEMKESKEASVLAKTLIKIAHDSAADINIREHIPTQLTRFDLRAILTDLGKVNSEPEPKLVAALSPEMRNHGGDLSQPSFQETLARQYQAFIQAAAKKARSEGIKKTSFATLVRKQSYFLNKKRWDLTHINIEKRIEKAVEKYYVTGNRSVVWDEINRLIAENKQIYEGTGPYEVVLSENEDPLHGISIRHIFDGKKNREVLVLRALVEDGKVNLESAKIPLNEAFVSRLAWVGHQNTSPLRGSARLAEGNTHDGVFELRMPIDAYLNGSKLSAIAIILNDENKAILLESPLLKNPAQCATEEMKHAIEVHD